MENKEVSRSMEKSLQYRLMNWAGKSYYTLGVIEQSEPFLKAELIDRILVNADELGVQEARAVAAQTLQQPYGPFRLLAVKNADELSDVVQNTWLKLIEEPPPFLTVVLEVRTFEKLLPTVRSRLHKLEGVKQGASKERQEMPEGLFVNEAVTRRVLTETKDRAELVAVLRAGIEMWEQRILEKPNALSVKNLEQLEWAVQKLSLNANQKLTVDTLLLNWIFR